jgi:hypothetical protein
MEEFERGLLSKRRWVGIGSVMLRVLLPKRFEPRGNRADPRQELLILPTGVGDTGGLHCGSKERLVRELPLIVRSESEVLVASLVKKLEDNEETSIDIGSGKLPGSMFVTNWYNIGRSE